MSHRFAKLPLAAAAVLLALPTLAGAAPATWTINQPHTRVTFSVRHILTPVPGQFRDFDGALVYDPADPAASKVDFTVQAASIDTGNDKRDAHLRSPDFFEVDKYPTLTFHSKKVAALGDGLAVTGDLTLHGVTKEVTVPVEVLGVMGDKAGFQTGFTLDRKDFGLVWNRTLDQGGTLLGDEVKVELTIEADRAKPEG